MKCGTVAELQKRMSSQEWQEWRIYMRRRPRIERRIDIATTLITWHIDMVRRMIGGKAPGKIDYYFPWSEKQEAFEPLVSPKDVNAKMKLWMHLKTRQLESQEEANQ